MRRVIVLATLIAAAASPALALQDRYGPPRPYEPVQTAPTPLPAGAVLGWKGKTAAPAPATPAQPPISQPPTPTVTRFEPARQTETTPPPVYQPASYRPSFAPAPSVAGQSRPLLQSQPAAAAQIAPPAPVAPPLQAASAAAPARAAISGNAGPRFYSVARQYGGAPDPIPLSQPRGGEALTLAETPATPGLGRSFAPLDDGRANQAVAVPDTKQNAAANRVSRLGL